MVNIPNDKKRYFEKENYQLDIKNPKDIMGKKEIKVKDILTKDQTINKMSEIFPQSQKREDYLGWCFN